MTAYGIIQRLLQLAPFAFIPALMFALRRWPTLLRYASVILVGWIGLAAFVVLYWDFSVDFAPNEEVATYFASRDSAPTTFAMFFGWIFVALYMGLLETFRLAWLGGRRRVRPRRAV